MVLHAICDGMACNTRAILCSLDGHSLRALRAHPRRLSCRLSPLQPPPTKPLPPLPCRPWPHPWRRRYPNRLSTQLPPAHLRQTIGRRRPPSTMPRPRPQPGAARAPTRAFAPGLSMCGLPFVPSCLGAADGSLRDQPTRAVLTAPPRRRHMAATKDGNDVRSIHPEPRQV